MLDSTTKKRIDDIRDILVGKVTNPIQQVEQITVALIYKFMDDMDMESVELGGERKFFSHEYEKFAWSNLFSSELGGTERVKLYEEAMERMELNPYIPQLFRNIFKNAYLPYRDPETLRNFLKYINDFNYSHSEKLGDAFEYLLSILGSQGDAGQFRTPRHIIDFMAAMIDPQKGETILDPACGTAGFLISAYKHILKTNSSNYDPDKDMHAFEMHGVNLDEMTVNGKHYKGDKLTPDERNLLTNNVRGYDISPDMVRLSLVNMYLHGFPEPHIYEYDTLTSDDRWNEFYDVILANPPFMSPKGGIRPHKRFSVQSKRSEVLFVDYMAEHLTANGRAAIIVPEGIIFQTGTAYKSLRKMLVDENYLVGVISLPAGVFNPYSAVKTSILWLDKKLARKTDNILFVKIENDGFDLGAQRRPIKQNDLPGAFQKITEYRNALQHNETIAFDPDSDLDDPIVSIVSKEKIRENEEYNLSGERYKIVIDNRSDYNYVPLGTLANITSSKRIFKDDYVDKGIPFYRTKEIVELNKKKPISLKLFISQEKYGEIREKYGVPKKNDILISAVGTLGIPWIVEDDREFYFKDGNLIWIKNIENAKPEFVKFMLEEGLKNQKDDLSIGAAYKALTIVGLKKFQIPLPPLLVQEEIVAEIEGYQKIIDGARMVVDNYKPQIDIDPDWEMAELGKIADFKNGLNYGRSESGEKLKIVSVRNFQDYIFAPINDLEDVELDKKIPENYLLKKGDLLFVRSNGNQELVGRSIIIPQLKDRVTFSGFTIRCRLAGNVNPVFYAYLFKTPDFRKKLINLGRGANIRNLNQQILSSLKVPKPNVERQQQIVTRIEQEQSLVNANKQLIEIYEQKIKDRIGKVWGE